MSSSRGYYGIFPEFEQKNGTSMDYNSNNCDIMTISSCDSDSEISELGTPKCVSSQQREEIAAAHNAQVPVFKINDPLRYFMDIGEITSDEYHKWKIVKEETEESKKSTKVRPDYGAGYNSDSDDDDCDENDEPKVTFGSGYSCFEYDIGPFDHWNPRPDPTPSKDRRYTKLAKDNDFLLSRLTQFVPYDCLPTEPGEKFNYKISNSLQLKINWERFKKSSSSYRFQSLQEFWQENALMIYEFLQDLIEDQARIYESNSKSVSKPPQYHTTPVETLENTFETIGRMSRCIAEDFNTQSVINYVEEFIISLYKEIEFNILVEVHEYNVRKSERVGIERV